MTDFLWAALICYSAVALLAVFSWSYFGGRQERAIAAKKAAAEAAEKSKA